MINKQEILENVKGNMVEWIKQLSIENIDVTKVEIDSHFNFLFSLSSLNSPIVPINLFSSIDKVIEPMETLKEINFDDTEKEATDTYEVEVEEEEKDYIESPMERLVNGGRLRDSYGVFVPESLIRNNEWVHGDIIRATVIGEKYGKPSYSYEKVGYENIGSVHREEIKGCVVVWEHGEYVVKSSVMDEFPEDEVYTLHDGSVNKFNLKEGDIVDIARINHNHLWLAIWKYDTDEESPSTITIEQRRMNGQYKVKEKTEKEESEQVLEGLQVLVVGGEPRKAEFKFQIERLGGSFEWMEGNEGIRLESAIKRSDRVVFMTRMSSHNGFYDTVEICKENDIPYSIVDKMGIQSMLDGVLHPYLISINK